MPILNFCTLEKLAAVDVNTSRLLLDAGCDIRFRLRNATIVQEYASTKFFGIEMSNYMELRRGFLKMIELIEMTRYAMREHNLGGSKSSGKRLVEFCNFHRLVIGGTLF